MVARIRALQKGCAGRNKIICPIGLGCGVEVGNGRAVCPGQPKYPEDERGRAAEAPSHDVRDTDAGVTQGLGKTHLAFREGYRPPV